MTDRIHKRIPAVEPDAPARENRLQTVMFELLEDPAYRHVLLNHLPVTGLAIAWIVLLVGLLARERTTLLAGLALVVVTAGSAFVVIPAGNDAYPFVFGELDGDGQAWLDHHTYLADTWGIALYLTAGLAALAIAAGVSKPAWLVPSAAGVTLAALGSLIAVFVIADAGGKIKHPEFRLTYPPVHEGSPRTGGERS